MDFEILITNSAEKDIENAIDYYINVLQSIDIAEKFYTDLNSSINSFSINPYYRFYQSFRGKPLSKFPYIVFFDVHEKSKIVEILGVLIQIKI